MPYFAGWLVRRFAELDFFRVVGPVHLIDPGGKDYINTTRPPNLAESVVAHIDVAQELSQAINSEAATTINCRLTTLSCRCCSFIYTFAQHHHYT